MQNAVPMIELWRGGMLESVHQGHAVICGASGEELESWGDPDQLIFPRSSCKMIQALPLLESGAADAAGLTTAHLALACASHHGTALHVDMARKWLADLGLGEADLRCGAHEPSDLAERDRLVAARENPCQFHNNCSGKHSGFLTTTKHLKAGPEYLDIDHPLQRAIKAAFEDVTGETSPGYGIDGCSAPNHACTVTGLARAMQTYAVASDTGSTRARAMHRLTRAMARFPELVAGRTGACTELMRAMQGRVTIKGGAEAVYTAILPDQKIGIALKIADGGMRAAEAAVTGLLIRAGVLDAAHPAALKRLGGPMRNWRGLEVGETRLAPGFL